MERARLAAEQQSSGKTQIAWCKEHGISRRTLSRWVLDVKGGEVQSDCAADWAELNVCNSAPNHSLLSNEVIEILVGRYTIHVKPCFEREMILDVCRMLGEI
jgi:hypothetical protein